MTDQDTTNPAEDQSFAEVEDALNNQTDTTQQADPNPDDGDDEGEEFADGGEGDEAQAEELEEIEYEGKKARVPKELKDAFLRQSDYTRKTQEIAETRRALENDRNTVQQSARQQAEFMQDIANIGAMRARLASFNDVTDWPHYLRTGGSAAQADFAEFNALQNQHQQMVQGLQWKAQQSQMMDQQRQAQAVQAGRAELAKVIPGYSDATLGKLEQFGATFGFSSEEIRQAEADPRSLRVLHAAMEAVEKAARTQRTSTLAQTGATPPVKTLKGTGARNTVKPDTNDFLAFERLAAPKMGNR